MRQLATATFLNQDLHAALLSYTFAADADRGIFFRLFLDQIAGGGNYTAYLTVQRLGAGTAFRGVPLTTATVPSGVTAVMLTTGILAVKSGDVVNVYVVGLASDTTTPTVIVEVWDDCLPPAAPGENGGLVTTNGIKVNQTVDLSAGQVTDPTATLSQIKAKTDLISLGDLRILSPLTSSGDQLTLVSGDDYYHVHGRAIEFVSSDYPDLFGASCELRTPAPRHIGAGLYRQRHDCGRRDTAL